MKSIRITTTISPQMDELFKRYKIRKSEALKRGLYFILEERKAGIEESTNPHELRVKIARMAIIIDDLQGKLNNFWDTDLKDVYGGKDE